jgi:hypothetical protein
MSDSDISEPTSPSPREKILAALTAIPGHEMDQAKLNVIATSVVAAIEKKQRRKVDLIAEKLEKKVARFQAALEAHGIHITVKQAVICLPGYFDMNPDTAANKVLEFTKSFESEFGIKAHLYRFFSHGSSLGRIVQARTNLLVQNLVEQYDALTQAGIHMDRKAYALAALETNFTGHQPETILNRAYFLLEAHALNWLSTEKKSMGDVILSNTSLLGRPADKMAAFAFHKKLSPLFQRSGSKVGQFSYSSLTDTNHSKLMARELVAMLGHDPRKKTLAPFQEKEGLSPVEKGFAENLRRKHALLQMLIEFNFAPGYTLDPLLVPNELSQSLKKRTRTQLDTVSRQCQRFYAVKYFGKNADQLSVFEIYQRVMDSEIWKAVVIPAQQALNRQLERQARQAAEGLASPPTRKQQADALKAAIATAGVPIRTIPSKGRLQKKSGPAPGDGD